MGGFQTGYCNIEKSILYLNWKRGVSILLKSKKNKKEGTVLKVQMPHLETCRLQTGRQLKRGSSCLPAKCLCWEATVTGGLETGPRFSFKTGHCNLKKSALFFISFRNTFLVC